MRWTVEVNTKIRWFFFSIIWYFLNILKTKKKPAINCGYFYYTFFFCLRIYLLLKIFTKRNKKKKKYLKVITYEYSYFPTRIRTPIIIDKKYTCTRTENNCRKNIFYTTSADEVSLKHICVRKRILPLVF